ncbi:MAG: Uma2 family endonuclease [Pirellulaceae bacterium]
MSLADLPSSLLATNPRPKRWSEAEFSLLIERGVLQPDAAELLGGAIFRPAARSRAETERPWTRTEYYRLGELGFFSHERVQLIDGEIFIMLPQNPPHAVTVKIVEKVLERLFGDGYSSRAQLPLDLGQTQEPEPDVAIVVGNPRDYLNEHPQGAALVVEVADSTLAFDRKKKGLLYARAGIADYWIVNLIDGCLEVYRRPTKDGYRQRTVHEPDEMIAPLKLPQQSILVSELLP